MRLYPVAILAGGLAMRLRPLTNTIPKSLILINDEPFINHQLRLLSNQGVQQVILCVGYLGEMIRSHVGNGSQFGLQVDYVFDGSSLLGTAGAIKNALPRLGEFFFITYGDSYLDIDYGAVQKHFDSCNKKGLMTVYHNEGQWDTSNVEFKDGCILAYNKKIKTDRMTYIDYGLGVFSKQAFSKVLEGRSYDLADLYQELLLKNELVGYEVEHRFYEIGSTYGIQQLSDYLSQAHFSG